MSSKAVLRLIIGCVIAALLLVFLLPAIGVPKSYLLPPAVVFESAKGTANAFVSKKNTGGNPNPFKSTETMYYLTYRFRAESPKNLIEKPTKDDLKKKKLYIGRAAVSQAFYDTIKNPDKADDGDNNKKPELVKVRYEITRPDISGIVQDGKNLNDQGGAAFFGSWMLFVGGIILMGYIIAPILQTFMLREDF